MNNTESKLIWITGLAGAGKSTVCRSSMQKQLVCPVHETEINYPHLRYFLVDVEHTSGVLFRYTTSQNSRKKSNLLDQSLPITKTSA